MTCGILPDRMYEWSIQPIHWYTILYIIKTFTFTWRVKYIYCQKYIFILEVLLILDICRIDKCCCCCFFNYIIASSYQTHTTFVLCVLGRRTTGAGVRGCPSLLPLSIFCLEKPQNRRPSVPCAFMLLFLGSASCCPTGGVSPLRSAAWHSATRCEVGGSDSPPS